MKRPITWEIDDDEELERRVHVATAPRDPMYAALTAEPMRRRVHAKRAGELGQYVDRYEYEDDGSDDSGDSVMVHDSWLLPPPSMPSLAAPRIQSLRIERLASLHPSAPPSC